MSYWIYFEVFPGDSRQGTELKTFEAASDKDAIAKANEIASRQYFMVGEFRLEEFRELGSFPKPEKSKKADNKAA